MHQATANGDDVLAGDWRRAGRLAEHVAAEHVAAEQVARSAGGSPSRVPHSERVDGGAGARAGVAAASRLFVEGRHDAELIEKVWGDDLRVEAVVVEMLGGVDDLSSAIAAFRPGPSRRMGVLR